MQVLNKLNDFENDLKKANQFENELTNYLNYIFQINQTVNFYSATKKNDFYDIFCFDLNQQKSILNIEAKQDFKTIDTNNVSIELYKKKNKEAIESGLTVTKSELYVIQFPNFKDEVYFIETKKIFDLVKNKQIRRYNNHGYICSLISFKDFEKECFLKLNINNYNFKASEIIAINFKLSKFFKK